MAKLLNSAGEMGAFYRMIGSPFSNTRVCRPSDAELLEIYDSAFQNRVGLLYLSLHRSDGWDARLETKYQLLAERERATLSVIAELAKHLNAYDPEKYVVFKSVKPYPATPNDTDVICLGDNEDYEAIYAHLLKCGYKFHEWAPQQRTLYDARGEGKIGIGKRGGTYYIDLYQEISTDYFSYMNKQRLLPFVITRMVNGTLVRMLKAEPELAIVMFHSVFPERTFQLEHFYMPLYTFANPEFDTERFIRFSKDSGVAFAVRTQCSLIARIHERYFGFIPQPLGDVLAEVGRNEREVLRFERQNMVTPYLFSPRTFWTAFVFKCNEWHSIRSLLVQCIRMLNPKFFVEVLSSIRRRLSEKGIYHLE